MTKEEKQMEKHKLAAAVSLGKLGGAAKHKPRSTADKQAQTAKAREARRLKRENAATAIPPVS